MIEKRIEETNDLIDELWMLVSHVREHEEIQAVAQVIRLGANVRDGDYKFVGRPFVEHHHPNYDQLSKEAWADEIRRNVRSIEADIVVMITEAYLPPPGMMQAAIGVVMAGGRVADLPGRIEAVVMSVETTWGKSRMIWREIKNERLCGDVVDTNWIDQSDQRGTLSNFFRHYSTAK